RRLKKYHLPSQLPLKPVRLAGTLSLKTCFVHIQQRHFFKQVSEQNVIVHLLPTSFVEFIFIIPFSLRLSVCKTTHKRQLSLNLHILNIRLYPKTNNKYIIINIIFFIILYNLNYI